MLLRLLLPAHAVGAPLASRAAALSLAALLSCGGAQLWTSPTPTPSVPVAPGSPLPTPTVPTPTLPTPTLPGTLPQPLPGVPAPLTGPASTPDAGAVALPSALTNANQIAEAARAEIARCGGGAAERGDGRLAAAALIGQDLQGAAQALGTPAKRSLAIQGGMPASLSRLRQALAQNCSNFTGTGWVVEVYMRGNEYSLALWRRLIPGWITAPGGARQAEAEMLRYVNLARAKGGVCGTEAFSPSGPLEADSGLSRTITGYVSQQAAGSLTGHTGLDGSDPGSRATRQGVEWRMIGENLAYGTSDPRETVEALLKSPGHCRNILNPQFTRMGSGYATGGKWGLTWGQLFAR